MQCLSTLQKQISGSPLIHQDPLRGNGRWFPCCLHQDPLRDNGHLSPYVYLKTLYEAMIIDFLIFTSRPFVRQWSLISLCLHKYPLQGNGHGFRSHRGPLWGNCYQFLYIKAFCEAMVINFLH